MDSDPPNGTPPSRPSSRGTHRLRLGRRSIPGQIYLVTTVTHERQPVFSDFFCARLVIRELMACDASLLSETLAYVLMPDHLHWLLRLRGGSLATLIRALKGRSAASVNAFRRTPGRPLWQKGFHDHAVRQSENVRDVAWYIVRNPVAAGLVAHENLYPHWDVLVEAWR